MTRADVEVQPYAFTTKSLYVGHTDYKYLRWQVRSRLCLVVLYLYVRYQVPACAWQGGHVASVNPPVLGGLSSLRLWAGAAGHTGHQHLRCRACCGPGVAGVHAVQPAGPPVSATPLLLSSSLLSPAVPL